ncbi:sarcosine oxidase subunit gamma [Hwanghaeella sp.]|uniref:sarcosine oxidase subunit gamma n=1 Tax=Hwanghaeella sp. TaxID=2605943 RepID=UPI003CCBD1A5
MTLQPKSPLNGYSETFDGTELAEATGLGLVSIATPRDGAEALNAALQSAYGCGRPDAGTSTASGDGSMRLLGLQQDQIFALFPHSGDRAVTEIATALGEVGYYTDQSDSWAFLRLSGPAAIPALQRICTLDLDVTALPVGSVARTAMEHMGVILLREGTDAFLLMGARSSAGNFLHAVEQSVRNVT